MDTHTQTHTQSKRETETENERDLPSLGSLSKWLQWPGRHHNEARSLKYHVSTGAQVQEHLPLLAQLL